MHNKLKRFLSILLIVVLCAAILVGCNTNVFSQNAERYRDEIAMSVGAEKVTMGEIIDWFNINAYSYLQQGSDPQSVWDALFPQFITQKIMINEYKLDSSTVKYSGAINERYINGEYLTSSALELVRKTVYVSLLESLDTSVETLLTDRGFDFEAAEEETARESMTNYGTISSVTDLSYDTTKAEKDANKKLAKYNMQDIENHKVNYVFSLGSPLVDSFVEKLNDRLGEDAEAKVTADEYITAQQKAYNEAVKNIRNGYNKSMADYLKVTIEDQIKSEIAMRNYRKINNGIEASVLADTASFNARIQHSIDTAINNYTLNYAAFNTFITNLSASSIISYVPEQFKNEFYFVLNLLIPFSDAQVQNLTEVSSQFTETSSKYIEYRQELAKKIEIKKYSEDVADGESVLNAAEEKIKFGDIYNFSTGLFTNTLESFDGTETYDFNGTMEFSLFKKAIFDYSTDPGSMNAAYPYVISKRALDLADADNFVWQFSAASKELVSNNITGEMGLCITNYGIHILYNAGPVTADVVDINSVYNYGTEAGSASYRFFSTYLNSIIQTESNLITDGLNKSYRESDDPLRKIEYHGKVLEKFLNEYKIILNKN